VAINEITIGLDLGQKQDPSALSVLQSTETGDAVRDLVTYEWKRDRVMRLIHMERIGLATTYPDIVERIRKLLQIPSLKDCTLVVDATGVGVPVVDLLRAARLTCRIIPVTITGGAGESSSGSGYSVPKRDLITGLQVLFECGRFEMPESMPSTEHLVQELAGMRAKPSRSGHWRYEGAPDDLALSLALAWWWARKRFTWDQPRQVTPLNL
jgi:hypothetical protein